MALPLLLLRRLVKRSLKPLRDSRPASRLIRKTARQEWRLISLSLGSNLVQAVAEGATLGVVFLAVDLLSKPANKSIDWTTKGFLNSIPYVSDTLNSIPRNELFLLLLGLAVLFKLIQSGAMYAGAVAMGYYTARTSSRLMAMIHSHTLGFSFSCDSRFRVGELLYIGASGPGANMTEIYVLSNLLLTISITTT